MRRIPNLVVLSLAACGSPPAPVTHATASPPVESTSASAPVASAPAAEAPPEIDAPRLLASATPICTLKGKLGVNTHELRKSSGGGVIARVKGQPDARVLVLPDGHLFAELVHNA